MKKGVAILLIAIMLLTGIQPVLSLHLCAGTLFSVTLLDEAESASCCEMPMQAAPDISAGQRHSAKNASSEIDFFYEDCCGFQAIEISTDEFTRDAEQQTTQNLTQLTDAWGVIISLLQSITPDNTLTLTQLFPPAGLSRLTSDLLTFICIYRI